MVLLKAAIASMSLCDVADEMCCINQTDVKNDKNQWQMSTAK